MDGAVVVILLPQARTMKLFQDLPRNKDGKLPYESLVAWVQQQTGEGGDGASGNGKAPAGAPKEAGAAGGARFAAAPPADAKEDASKAAAAKEKDNAGLTKLSGADVLAACEQANLTGEKTLDPVEFRIVFDSLDLGRFVRPTHV